MDAIFLTDPGNLKLDAFCAYKNYESFPPPIILKRI